VGETIARAGSGRVIAGAGQMDPGSLPADLRIHGICDCRALLVSAAIGYTRLASEQHSALRNAVAEFSARQAQD
jgi:hypothetical protein